MPKGVYPRPLTVEERFWAKVDKTDDCWLWTAHRQATGYGQFSPSPGHPVGAHRFAWELAHGPIPAGMYVCHHCDVRACVRVDHLFLGSPRDNMADMVAKGRGTGSITHCKYGHEFTPENTRVYKRRDGITARICRACRREQERERRAR